MDWLVIAVIVLAAVWGFLWHKTKQGPVEEPAIKDPRQERARELLTAAAAAEQAGDWENAQRARLEATWLRTDPPVGHDAPPTALDPNVVSHLRLADAIRQRYAAVLSEKGHPHADCTFQPAARLPFPRDDVARTLDLLMAIGRGEVASAHVGAEALSEDEIAVVERSRELLETFLPVEPADLPTDPEQNVVFGQRLRTGD